MRLGTSDIETIQRIMLHEDVFPDIVDDYTDISKGKQLAWGMVSQPLCYMLHPAELVLFMVGMRTMTIYECHTMITPEGRNKAAVGHAKEAAKWLFENTQCEKVITYVPVDNRKAKLFAHMVGFKSEGTCTKSIRRNGELMDQWVLGLEKESFLCQQQ